MSYHYLLDLALILLSTKLLGIATGKFQMPRGRQPAKACAHQHGYQHAAQRHQKARLSGAAQFTRWCPAWRAAEATCCWCC